MRTNIKVSLKKTVDAADSGYDNVGSEVDSTRTVDILLQGDTAIIQDIIKSIPVKYKVV